MHHNHQDPGDVGIYVRVGWMHLSTISSRKPDDWVDLHMHILGHCHDRIRREPVAHAETDQVPSGEEVQPTGPCRDGRHRHNQMGAGDLHAVLHIHDSIFHNEQKDIRSTLQIATRDPDHADLLDCVHLLLPSAPDSSNGVQIYAETEVLGADAVPSSSPSPPSPASSTSTFPLFPRCATLA